MTFDSETLNEIARINEALDRLNKNITLVNDKFVGRGLSWRLVPVQPSVQAKPLFRPLNVAAKEKEPEKQPAGVLSHTLWQEQRAKSLARAIYENLSIGFSNGKYSAELLEWSGELDELLQEIIPAAFKKSTP